MHGDSPEYVTAKISDMRERRERFGLPPMQFGVAGYELLARDPLGARFRRSNRPAGDVDQAIIEG